MLEHVRLGHPNFRVTAEYCLEYNIPLPARAKLFCEQCAQEKVRKRAQSRKSRKAPADCAFRNVQMDICGPFPIKSKRDGFKYLIAFIDNTGTVKVYGVRGLENVSERVLAYLDWVAAQQGELMHKPTCEITEAALKEGVLGPLTGGRIHHMNLQSDSASYFRAAKLRRELREHPITVNLSQSAPYEQAKNGRVERVFQTLIQRGAAMRYTHNLPPEYWCWPCRHAAMMMAFSHRVIFSLAR